MIAGEVCRGFFQELKLHPLSRVSRSSSRSRARSFTVSGGSSPACSRRQALTQLPRVPSLMPSSFATRAIGRDVSITIFTASSLNSGEKLFFSRGNYFTFPDIHPIGWAVRKPRGTPVRILGVSRTRVMNVSGSDCSSCGSSRRSPVQGWYCRPGAGVDEFFLAGREERFRYGIVVADSGPAQGSPDIVLRAVGVEDR